MINYNLSRLDYKKNLIYIVLMVIHKHYLYLIKIDNNKRKEVKMQLIRNQDVEHKEF